MASNKSSAQYHCDTLPEPQNLTIDFHRDPLRRDLSPAIGDLHIDVDSTSSAFDVPTHEELLNTVSLSTQSSQQAQPSNVTDRAIDDEPTNVSRERKLCVRHLRMADEGTLNKLQRSLEALSPTDRQAVNSIWSTFSSSSHPRRATILQGLIHMCCFSQLSFLTEQLNLLIRLDPLVVFPREVSLKVLGYLDAFSLCRAAQVNKTWSFLSNDDTLWHSICQQHIGHKCRKCGWGLPLMGKKRPTLSIQQSALLNPPDGGIRSNSPKRDLEPPITPRPAKRQRSEPLCSTPQESETVPPTPPNQLTLQPTSTSMDVLSAYSIPPVVATRPWKSVYYERLTIERNWRRGRSTVRTLKGHTDGVMCMQFSENLTHPSFPVLITGSYDRTARVWNLDTGEQISVLTGHGRAVRTLQFDNAKLITGSMDRTLKVWNWRTGVCVRTLEGHTEGVVCLNFDSNVLASGSVDATVKIWNFRTGDCFTLRGHRDWVNSLQLWDPIASNGSMSSSSSSFSEADIAGLPDLDPGKMLFSASDDGSIKLWDLTERTCVRTFTGHVGQVQSIKLLSVDCEPPDLEESGVGTPDRERSRSRDSRDARAGPILSYTTTVPSDSEPAEAPSPPGSACGRQREARKMTSEATPEGLLKKKPGQTQTPILISGSLDNTVKIWDIETGKETSTLFGHIEGIWGVVSSPLRIVSASHDRTIKVWSREDGKCTATLVGHRSPVTCLSMSDDKIVSGSDDGDIRVWDFGA